MSFLECQSYGSSTMLYARKFLSFFTPCVYVQRGEELSFCLSVCLSAPHSFVVVVLWGTLKVVFTRKYKQPLVLGFHQRVPLDSNSSQSSQTFTRY